MLIKTDDDVLECAIKMARHLGRSEDSCLAKIETWRAETPSRARKGSPMNIRVERNARYTGPLSRAELGGIRFRGRSVIAQYNVWLLAGTKKVERGPFLIERLPV